MGMQYWQKLVRAGLVSCSQTVSAVVDASPQDGSGGWSVIYFRNLNAAAGADIFVRIMASPSDAVAVADHADHVLVPAATEVRVALHNAKYFTAICKSGQSGDLYWRGARD